MREVKQTSILLESGTNELEIMEFTIDNNHYGINVAKVREIMKVMPIQPMQKAHPFVEGIFKPRDKVITVINLASYLGLSASDNPDRDIFVVANFNGEEFAFHIHAVVGITNVSWTQIKKVDKVVYGGDEGVATGVADLNNRLVTILDFEKIIVELNPHSGIQYSEVESLGERASSSRTILMAEDSMVLSKMIVSCLERAGYVNIIKTENGQEAWDILCDAKSKPEPITHYIDVIVTDIEMPMMDGHRLTKLIKTDAKLKELPVILFSSIISDEMRIKGKELGANEQISKPEIGRLVGIIDGFFDEYK